MGKDILMAEIIVSDIFTDDGVRKDGKPWSLTKWTDQNGIKFSSFQLSAREVTRGSKVRIQYTSGEKGNDIIKDGFTVLTVATAEQSAATPPPAAANGKPAWERDEALSATQRIDQEHRKNVWIARESMAATVLRHVADLLNYKLDIPDDLSTLRNRIITWGTALFPSDDVAGVSRDVAEAVGKMAGALPDEAKQQAVDEASELTGGGQSDEDLFPDEPSDNGYAKFKNVGELLMWCNEQGVARPAFMEIVGVKDSEMSKVNLTEAYQKIKGHLAAKPAA